VITATLPSSSPIIFLAFNFVFAIGILHCDRYGGNPTNYLLVEVQVLLGMLQDLKKAEESGP
jgi:hypothetical protein